jgi:hypothetical protein
MKAAEPTTPGETTIGGRGLYLLYLLSAVVSLALIAAAFGERDGWLAARGFAAMLVAALLRMLLRHMGQLEACQREDEIVAAPVGPWRHESAAIVRLRALISQQEALEARRGSAEFDPWEFGALRQQVSVYARQHPEAAAAVEYNLD